MNLHKLTAGNGWRYYWVETASHDETRSSRDKLVDYYAAASGNPPGEWVGHGTESLQLAGPVKERQMEHLFGLGRHPDTGARLGQDYAIYRSEEERIEARLATEPDADDQRRGAIIAEEQAKPTREAVSGWDMTFAPVKSVSILWGIAEDRLRTTIEDCHQAAWRDALAWIEDEVIYTRRGRNGIAHAAVDGFIAAAFMHRTSRAGDPHLHTHVVASNKVRTLDDDSWRTLDGKLLYDAKVAASERYNSRLETLLADRLGLRFTDDAGGQREVAGVPEALRRRFSARRLQVEVRFADLVSDYRARHGHEPPHDVEYRLAQQATLETRPRKKNGTTPVSERDEWRSVTEHETLASPEVLIATVLGRHQRRSPTATDADRLVNDTVTRTLQGVHERRAQWTVMHVRAEAERAVRDLDLPTAAHTALVDRVVTATLAHPTVISLTPGSLIAEPDELRLPNGDPIWRTANTRRYTTTTILDAEAALVDAARSAGAPTVDEVTEACVLVELAAEGHELAVDQAAAVAQIGRSGRTVDLLIAPAGAGKSHTMHAVAAVWSAGAGRVIGLAPTARAARGLADSAALHEIGSEAHTIDNWLLHTDRGDWQLQPGDLVIVDEAGMASTPHLDALRLQVIDADAKLLLVGDHRQLAAVGAGGALRHLHRETGAFELSSLWRFADTWESLATVRLRDGNLDVIDEYLDHDRIRVGTASKLTERMYQAWRSDVADGHTSVMLAVSNHTVGQLNDRARRDLINAGTVEADGVLLANGTTIGTGDSIVTRRNRADLRVFAGKDWVHNGDLWSIDQVHDDGSLTVTHTDHEGRIRLPADYVDQHVELGYASTVARAQGITVDIARVLIDTPAMDRANLYVAMTRGRHLNEASLVTRDELDTTIDRPRYPTRDAHDMLTAILQREADRSATEQLRAEQDAEWGLPTLAARYEHVCDQLAAQRLRQLVETAIGGPDAQAIVNADAWPALRAQLRRLEHHDLDVADVLDEAYRRRSLTDAVDLAAVLHHRVERQLGDDAQPGTYLGLSPAPTEDDPAANWARKVHAHLTAQLDTLVPLDLRGEWAMKLRRDHIPDDLVETIATWRALHSINDETVPLGPEPTRSRAAPDHRSCLNQQLTEALDQTHQDRAAHLERLHAEPLPMWTVWLGQPPTDDDERRHRWYEAVADVCIWRDRHNYNNDQLPWPDVNHAPAAIADAGAMAREAAADIRDRLAAAAARSPGTSARRPAETPRHTGDARGGHIM